MSPIKKESQINRLPVLGDKKKICFFLSYISNLNTIFILSIKLAVFGGWGSILVGSFLLYVYFILE